MNEYAFAKETASTLFSLGDAGYKKLMNILNMRKVSLRSQDEDFAPFATTQKNIDVEELEDFVGLTTEPLPKGSDTLSQESDNKITVIIRNIKDDTIICKFSPRYFNGITVIKFSSSGTLLLLGNENAQQFYIYKLFPETHCRHLSPSLSSGKAAVLLYTIFRGYTSAKVSSVQFSLNERWVIISSAKGTSHIYRLDEHTEYSNNPIISNHSTFDYFKLTAGQKITKLSAFNRFKYESATVKGDLWPVTAILTHCPLDKIEGGKELIDEQYITMFIAITRYGEVFSNALVIVKSEEKEVQYDFKGQKDYELLRKSNKSLVNRENYYNDKLIVKTLAQFELEVVSKYISDKSFTKKSAAKKQNVATTMTETKEFSKEEYKKKQKKWLKEILSKHFSSATPSIYVCPQFRFCTWDNPDSEKEPITEETVLCKEDKYGVIEKSPRSKLDLTSFMKESYLNKRQGEESEVAYEEPDNKNPFYDLDYDREFEERLSKALTTSMKPIEESEQKSQIFESEINVMDDYTPLK